MYITQEIANRIKFRIKERGVVTKDMLSELEMGINSISEFSKGKQMSCISLARIADYLDCSVDYLLCRTDDPKLYLLDENTKVTNLGIIDNINFLMEKNQSKNKDIANHLGLKAQVVTDWRAGRSESYKKYLPQIADFFNVSVDYLLGTTDTKPVPENNAGITFPTNDALSNNESKLLLTYKILTDEGKKKAADYLDDLAGNPNYVSDDEIIYLPTAAFDGRFAAGEKVPYTVKELRTLLSAEEIEGEDF